MKIEVSQVIDRPIADVFSFYAVDHVRNHPRWDPGMQLEQVSAGPIGVGTVIRRRHAHFGAPVEGTMEVVEYEPEQAIGVVIHDGSTEMRSRTTFHPEGDGRTTMVIGIDLPGMDESADPASLRSMVERSARTIKELIESEH